MAYSIERVPVWVAEVKDRPGGVADQLRALTEAGANLDFLIGRRDKPGKGVLFLTPLKGAAQARVATKLGLKKASLYSVRVEGPNKPGLGAAATGALADAEVNMRGISAAAIGRRAVINFAFDTAKDATKAIRVLKKELKIR